MAAARAQAAQSAREAEASQVGEDAQAETAQAAEVAPGRLGATPPAHANDHRAYPLPLARESEGAYQPHELTEEAAREAAALQVGTPAECLQEARTLRDRGELDAAIVLLRAAVEVYQKDVKLAELLDTLVAKVQPRRVLRRARVKRNRAVH